MSSSVTIKPSVFLLPYLLAVFLTHFMLLCIFLAKLLAHVASVYRCESNPHKTKVPCRLDHACSR